MIEAAVGTPSAVAGTPKVEIWGGVECSVVRIGNEWRDQVHETGHHARDGDLDRIVDLGITTLRYPIVWERVAPRAPGEYDWQWHDRRMDRLGGFGPEPIVGLLHH